MVTFFYEQGDRRRTWDCWKRGVLQTVRVSLQSRLTNSESGPISETFSLDLKKRL